jgi:Holliday junction resolvase RusA-like endonuclease
MIKICIKPLSVNQAWQGQRFKTPAYKKYEKDVLNMLPPLTVPDGALRLIICVGFSNKASDIDNVEKPFIDILQKKYKFDDKWIYQKITTKFIVKKGDEFIEFRLDAIDARFIG